MTWAEQLRAEGRREELVQLIECRFGPISPTLGARISKATIEELDGYTTRLLPADSVDAVLEMAAS